MGRSSSSEFWAGSSVRFKANIGFMTWLCRILSSILLVWSVWMDLMIVRIELFERSSSSYFLVSFSPFMIFVIVGCVKMPMRCHLL